MSQIVVISCLLIALLCAVECQRQNLRKGGRGKRPILDENQERSFTVAYPMGILTDSGNHFEKDWRSPAHKSAELAEISDNGKPYAFYAKAQDQEDIWLYENWFYGMQGLHFWQCTVNGAI